MIFKKQKDFPSNFDYIVVGLGNPGKQYETTRHNAGFICLDALADKHGISVKKLKFRSLLGEGRINGKRCLLMKPQTYMNLSGEAVRDAMEFYKIPIENLIVICDDISLDPGKMRIRRKGSDGGQRGMKNIIYHLKSDNFPRIKIGVGAKPNPEYDLADWVISHFTADEAKLIKQVTESCIGAVELMVDGKIDKAMSDFNS